MIRASQTQFIKSKDTGSQLKCNRIIATSGGMKPNSTCLKRQIHRIIAAFRFNEMRLIRRPLENDNILKKKQKQKKHDLKNVMEAAAAAVGDKRNFGRTLNLVCCAVLF